MQGAATVSKPGQTTGKETENAGIALPVAGGIPTAGSEIFPQVSPPPKRAAGEDKEGS